MKAYSYKPIFQKTVLDNGVRVVTESHPFTRAVSIGIFVESGTRHEDERRAGVTHFLEHLVFKGTKKRSAFDLAKVLEAVGGDLNAYTTREYTCFHAASLKEHVNLSLDVLSDLATNATLTSEDFETERQVILQELRMSKENLEESILDEFLEKSFAGHDLGIPILGTETSLARLTRAHVVEHYRSVFRGPNLIVSVAGPVEHDHVVDYIERTLGRLNRRPHRQRQRPRPKIKRLDEFLARPGAQVHLLVGLPSCSYKSGRRFESFVVNEVLGGGVTSRLYQKIREERGLVYAVHSFLQSFVDTGLLLVYAGASAKSAPAVLGGIRREIERLSRSGLRTRELQMFKTQIKGQILLGAEDMENRMSSLGINEMVFGQYRPVDEVIAEIDKVSLSSVSDYLQNHFDLSKSSLMVMGDLEPKQALRLLNTWE